MTDIPAWLDEDFFKNVLQKENTKSSQAEIVRFTCEPAVGAGNNFLSYMHRIRVQYRTNKQSPIKNLSLVVKVPIARGMFMEVQEKHKFFDREPQIYSKLLTSMYEKTKVAFGPKSFPSLVKNVIVAEDLKHKGFVMCEKVRQLDFDHCKLLVEHLAKFHATTVSCYHQDPTFIREIGTELLWAEGGIMEEMVASSIRSMIDVSPEIAGSEKFREYLIRRKDHFWNSVVQIFKPKTLGLNVLNHGDLWINNMMFSYESEKVKNVMFIDFQFTRYASPAHDLLLVTWTSANNDVKSSRLPELYRIYRETLNQTLEQLGCEERLTEEELKEDLKNMTDWAAVVLCQCLPIMMSDPDNAPDIEKLTREDFKRDDVYNSVHRGKIYRSLITHTFRDFTQFFLSEDSFIR